MQKTTQPKKQTSTKTSFREINVKIVKPVESQKQPEEPVQIPIAVPTVEELTAGLRRSEEQRYNDLLNFIVQKLKRVSEKIEVLWNSKALGFGAWLGDEKERFHTFVNIEGFVAVNFEFNLEKAPCDTYQLLEKIKGVFENTGRARERKYTCSLSPIGTGFFKININRIGDVYEKDCDGKSLYSDVATHFQIGFSLF